MMIISDCADYATAIREFDTLERARGEHGAETIQEKELRAAIKVYKTSINE